MIDVFEVDAFVIVLVLVIRIGAMEHRIAGGGKRLHASQQLAQWNALPFPDCAPSFDAIVPRDLCPRGKLPKLRKRKTSSCLDETAADKGEPGQEVDRSR